MSAQGEEIDMAPRARKEAYVSGLPNPPTTDPLDPSIAPPGNDGGDERDTPIDEDAQAQIGDELRHRMISEAAYQLYAERGYIDGLELDDWLQAENEVDRTLGGRRPVH
jgi:hypothetical protein